MAGSAAGRRVLVLGGETAAGRALAVALAEAGADVAIVATTASTEAEFAVNSALNELWAMGRGGLALAVDASDPAQLRAAVERVEADLGRLDAAAVVADESAVAIDELRSALAGRPVVAVPPDAAPQEAMTAMLAQL